MKSLRLAHRLGLVLIAAACVVSACVPEIDYRVEDDGPPVPCDPMDLTVCGEGSKCTVVDVATGTTGCVEAGPRPAFAKCTNEVECGPGLWCDLDKLVCKPICKTGNDCQPQQQCLAARRGIGSPETVPALSVCTAHCDPLNAGACNDDFGPTTCTYEFSTAEFECAPSLNLNEGESCGPYDCAYGLICLDVVNMGPTCIRWCTPTGTTDACGGQQCISISNLSPTFNGVEYGGCGLP